MTRELGVNLIMTRRFPNSITPRKIAGPRFNGKYSIIRRLSRNRFFTRKIRDQTYCKPTAVMNNVWRGNYITAITWEPNNSQGGDWRNVFAKFETKILILAEKKITKTLDVTEIDRWRLSYGRVAYFGIFRLGD